MTKSSKYEITFIARHDLSKQEVDALVKHVTDLVEGEKGSVKKNEYWGLRSLAYKINKHSKGHYAHICVDTPFAAIEEIERTMRLNEDVMRLMTIKVDEISDEPSPLLRKDRDEDDRGSRDRGSRDSRAA